MFLVSHTDSSSVREGKSEKVIAEQSAQTFTKSMIRMEAAFSRPPGVERFYVFAALNAVPQTKCTDNLLYFHRRFFTCYVFPLLSYSMPQIACFKYGT